MKTNNRWQGDASYRPKVFTFSKCNLALSFLLTVLLGACRLEPISEMPLLKLYGNGNAGNLSRNYILYATTCHVGEPGAFIAAPGDLLWIDNWMLLNETPLKSFDGAIHFVSSDSLLLLDGKVAGIRIDSGYQPHHLLNKDDKVVVRNLKVIAITPAGLALHKTIISDIAEQNAKCMLQLEGSFQHSELSWLLEIFAPVALSVEMTSGQQALLAGEQQLRLLYLQISDSAYNFQPLPALAALNEFIFDFDGNDILPSPAHKNWLQHNPQIKKLTVTDWGENYPAGMLSVLKAPEVLIMGGMEIPESEIMEHEKSLHRVILDSQQWQYQLPEAEWISLFNSDALQEEINELPSRKPGCTTLDIFANGAHVDVSPLKKLKNLQALTLVQADSIDTAPLMEMKNLTLLSWSADSVNTDSTLAVLRTALPHTVVVANEGFCLGSGWLLLFLPATGLAILMAKRKKQKIQST